MPGLVLLMLAFLLTQVQVTVAQCSGFVKYLSASANAGVIYSPNYPSRYGTNQDCKWRIIAPLEQRVLIYFTVFDLDTRCGCDCNAVKIFDGSYEYSSKMLAQGCSVDLPPPVHSSGHSIYVKFHSDWRGQGGGFVAYYKALNMSSGCPSIDPTASVGVIYSPNFPWNYPESTMCSWTITAPYREMIYLNFTDFNVEFSGDCCADYVEVRNYDFSRKFCGITIPSPIYKYGSLHVTFSSDYWYSRSGFMAFYQIGGRFPATPMYSWPPTRLPTTSLYGACQPYSNNRIFVESSSSSSIASPNYFNVFYTRSPRTSCSWQIQTSSGYILELTFEKMSITSCSGCSCGYVKVFDGITSSDPLIGTFCDENSPSLVSSKGSNMSIKYYGFYSYDEFRATIRSKKAKTVQVAAVVVPIVVGLVLFTIIVFVIKCTVIRPSARPTPGTSSTSAERPLLSLTQSAEAAAPGTAQPL